MVALIPHLFPNLIGNISHCVGSLGSLRDSLRGALCPATARAAAFAAKESESHLLKMDDPLANFRWVNVSYDVKTLDAMRVATEAKANLASVTAFDLASA